MGARVYQTLDASTTADKARRTPPSRFGLVLAGEAVPGPETRDHLGAARATGVTAKETCTAALRNM